MLYFTSFGFRSPIVANKLRPFLDPRGKTVLVIPAAGFDETDCFRREGKALLDYGFARHNILNSMELDPESISGVDCLYLPGGNTYKLLSYLQTGGWLPYLRRWVEQGTEYIGVSAGAVAAVTSAAYLSLFDEKEVEIDNCYGLGFTDDIVVPHADQIDPALLLACRRMSAPERKLTCIPNTGLAIYKEGEEGGFYYVDLF